MQILGLYHPGSPRNILETLKELHDAQSFLPIVLTLDRDSFLPLPGHMSIFPAFYSVERRATIHQVLAHSFCKDQDNYMLTKSDGFYELSIYLIDSSDIPSIHALIKDMTVTFPQIGLLNLWFERRCEIVSFLLTITVPDLKSICIILATTWDSRKVLFRLRIAWGIHLCMAHSMMEMQIRTFLKTGKMALWEVTFPELISLTSVNIGEWNVYKLERAFDLSNQLIGMYALIHKNLPWPPLRAWGPRYLSSMRFVATSFKFYRDLGQLHDTLTRASKQSASH